jgi:hypothetical protein
MEKVYVVHFDNGMSYDDHSHHVDCVFSNEEDATSYINDKNDVIKNPVVPSMTKEEYYAQHDEDICHDYDTFVEIEQDRHDWYMNAYYYYNEYQIKTTYEKKN